MNKEQILDELAQLGCQLAATSRALPLKTGEQRTAAEYKITFLTGKIEKLKSFLQ